ncbi:MAG: aminopeptidase P family protein [Chlamydiae bacterium]|nr:aminopeptidase P family protein [Chlamydiota bacterium]
MDRIKQVQSRIREKGVDVVLLEDKVDLYYLTGMWCSAGRLLIGQHDVLFLTDGRYEETAKTTLSCPVGCLSQEETKKFLDKVQAHVVCFDGARMSFDRVQELQAMQGEYVLRSWAGPLKEQRACKDSREIELLQKSADLLFEGYKHILPKLALGIKEKELAKAFTLFCLEKGADALAFEPIIAFGENSSLPHHRAGERALQVGDTVLIDIGVTLHGYASDMTRVTFFGDPHPKIREWLRIAKEAHHAALAICKPGIRCKDLDQAARKVLSSHGVEEYFVHGLGHGVGLEVHEFPRLRSNGPDVDVLLQPGMVITIEPGLYLPGVGGVRYEDTVYVTETGYVNFFQDN